MNIAILFECFFFFEIMVSKTRDVSPFIRTCLTPSIFYNHMRPNGFICPVKSPNALSAVALTASLTRHAWWISGEASSQQNSVPALEIYFAVALVLPWISSGGYFSDLGASFLRMEELLLFFRLDGEKCSSYSLENGTSFEAEYAIRCIFLCSNMWTQ